MTDFHFTKKDIIKALGDVNIKENDNIFVHSNIGFFGKLENANNENDYWKIFKEAIFHVIGSGGTLIVPTFTYSFCRNEPFDKQNTSSRVGLFSELVRTDSDSLRSEDANFSISAIGKNADYFTRNSPSHSLGEKSFWERLLKLNGIICQFNLDRSYNTFVHYVEKFLNVPYHYDKSFEGILIDNGIEVKKHFIHFVRDLDDPDTISDFTEIEKIAKKLGLIRETSLGRGKISVISCKDTLNLICTEIKKNPAFLIKGT